jgi:nucleoside-diphosphate-sugar epimerase
MRIAVTGGSGRIGRHVVRDLVRAGHEVTSLDRDPFPEASCRVLRVDLTDAGEVYQSLAAARAEAVVHLGAWANAGVVPDARTYGDNVRGTFHLLQSCADLGIRRVVSASSAQVYGLAAAAPVYLPLDEAHPLRPANCYALSKMAGEQAADYFVARFDLTILSFRFMAVRTPGEIGGEIEGMVRDPRSGESLLWTRTDARDAATACRLAVEADAVPSGPYNIAGPCVALPEPAADLAARHFGDRTQIRSALPGQASPMSCARAEAAFGYRPHYPWTVSRRHPDSEV